MSAYSPSADHPGASQAAVGNRWSPGLWIRARAQWTLTPLLLLGMLAAWGLACHQFGAPAYILPPPEAVLDALWDGLARAPMDQGGLWFHAGITVYESLCGLVLGALVGTLLGFALASFPLLDRVIYPLLAAFQALPKVALAPLLIIWFGLGYNGKIYITGIITFFPLLVSAMAGAHSVEADRIDLARSCNARPMQILRKIIIPSAMPYLFAGLNVASSLAVLGAIVGEFVGARAGLGMLLIQYNQAMQTAPVFAVLIVLGLIGFLFNYAVKVAEQHYCFWAQRRRHALRSGN